MQVVEQIGSVARSRVNRISAKELLPTLGILDVRPCKKLKVNIYLLHKERKDRKQFSCLSKRSEILSLLGANEADMLRRKMYKLLTRNVTLTQNVTTFDAKCNKQNATALK